MAQNENPNSQPYVPIVVKPPEGAHTRIHTPVFPNLNGAVIQELIREGMSKQLLSGWAIRTFLCKIGVLLFHSLIAAFLYSTDTTLFRNLINPE